MTANLHSTQIKSRSNRVSDQDTLSSKLIATVLEYVLKRLSGDPKGITTDKAKALMMWSLQLMIYLHWKEGYET